MKYSINAIETTYKGCVFRSRLEAKWAAMFDLLGWSWTYEPTDFCGWIPDFLINGVKAVFVEVKPVLTFPKDVAFQIDASGCKEEVLIVGMTCPLPSDYADSSFGWLREEDSWSLAVAGRWESSNIIGFCHNDLSYRDRISGDYDGSCGFGVTREEISRLWRNAGNLTKWERSEA